MGAGGPRAPGAATTPRPVSNSGTLPGIFDLDLKVYRINSTLFFFFLKKHFLFHDYQ